MTVLASAVSSFVIGVAVGMILKDAFAIARTGKGFTMTALGSLTRSRRAGLVLVSIALATNGVLGFLQIANGTRDEHRLDCSIRYNEIEGIARDDRAAQYARQVDAEVELWAQIRRDLRRENLTGEKLDATVTRYLRELRATRASRVENPFPAPDLCRLDP